MLVLPWLSMLSTTKFLKKSVFAESFVSGNVLVIGAGGSLDSSLLALAGCGPPWPVALVTKLRLPDAHHTEHGSHACVGTLS